MEDYSRLSVARWGLTRARNEIECAWRERRRGARWHVEWHWEDEVTKDTKIRVSRRSVLQENSAGNSSVGTCTWHEGNEIIRRTPDVGRWTWRRTKRGGQSARARNNVTARNVAMRIISASATSRPDSVFPINGSYLCITKSGSACEIVENQTWRNQETNNGLQRTTTNRSLLPAASPMTVESRVNARYEEGWTAVENRDQSRSLDYLFKYSKLEKRESISLYTIDSFWLYFCISVSFFFFFPPEGKKMNWMQKFG